MPRLVTALLNLCFSAHLFQLVILQVNAQDRATDEKFKDFAKSLEEDNHKILKKLDEQKEGLEGLINEEIIVRTNDVDGLREELANQIGSMGKVKQVTYQITHDICSLKSTSSIRLKINDIVCRD